MAATEDTESDAELIERRDRIVAEIARIAKRKGRATAASREKIFRKVFLTLVAGGVQYTQTGRGAQTRK